MNTTVTHNFLNASDDNFDLLDELLADINSFDEFIAASQYLEYSSLNNGGELSVQPMKKRKLKPRGRTAHGIKAPKPIVIHRILNADIRKKYGMMFANVFNSGNVSLLDSFFNKFRGKSLGFSKRPITQDYNCIFSRRFQSKFNSLPSLEVVGSEFVFFYFKYLMKSLPDLVINLSDMKLKQRSDSKKTQLIAKFRLQGTQFHGLNPMTILASLLNDSLAEDFNEIMRNEKLDPGGVHRNPAIPHPHGIPMGYTEHLPGQKRKRNSSGSSSSTSSINSSESPDFTDFNPDESTADGIERGMIRIGECRRYFDASYSLQDVRDDSPLYQMLDRPIALDFNGYLIFLADEEKRLEKIEFVMTSCSSILMEGRISP